MSLCLLYSFLNRLADVACFMGGGGGVSIPLHVFVCKLSSYSYIFVGEMQPPGILLFLLFFFVGSRECG